MKYPILICLALCLFLSCDKFKDLKNLLLTDCLKEEIRKAEADERTPIKSISKFSHKGTVYYYLLAECCDIFNEVLDAECNYVCAPDGGFSGMGDGKCPEDIPFEELLKNAISIWENGK